MENLNLARLPIPPPGRLQSLRTRIAGPLFACLSEFDRMLFTFARNATGKYRPLNCRLRGLGCGFCASSNVFTAIFASAIPFGE